MEVDIQRKNIFFVDLCSKILVVPDLEYCDCLLQFSIVVRNYCRGVKR